MHVIMAEPEEFAMTVPPLTVATPLLFVDQLTELFVALLGETVAMMFWLWPTSRLIDDGLIDRPLTGTVTVTEHVAVFPMSSVVQVMVAEPAALAVTRPLVLTDATLLLLVVHVTVLYVAFDGFIVGVSCSVLLTESVLDV